MPTRNASTKTPRPAAARTGAKLPAGKAPEGPAAAGSTVSGRRAGSATRAVVPAPRSAGPSRRAPAAQPTPAPPSIQPPGRPPRPAATERLDIRQLATLSNLPIRTVRYYIAQGLVDRPHGVRRGAWYDQRHLQQLLLIHRWRSSGVGLERVRELQAGAPEELPPSPIRPGAIEAWSRVTVSDGLEIHIEPHRATLSPEQLRAFVQAVTAAFRRVRASPAESPSGRRTIPVALTPEGETGARTAQRTGRR